MKQQPAEFPEVTVRCYGGEKARMLVVRDLGEVLVVCSPEEMETARVQSREPLTLGFKRESVAQWGK